MISLLIALLLCIYQSPILHLIKYVCFVLSTQKANECVLFVLLFFLFTSMQAANKNWASVQFSSLAQSCPALCDPMNCSTQASLSITNSQSLPKLMSIESVMPSSHLILCHPFLLLPSIPPIIRVFSNESTLLKRWPKYWNFSCNISPSNEYPGLFSFRMDWLDLLAVQGARKSLLQHHSSKVKRLNQRTCENVVLLSVQ